MEQGESKQCISKRVSRSDDCFIIVSVFGVSANCHNLAGFQYDWTAAAAAIETHRKPQPEPCDWLTYHVVAVIVAPYMAIRTLSLTGASGLP